MLQKTMIVFLLSFVTLYSQDKNWNREDTIRESIYVSVLSIDWLQTLSFQKEYYIRMNGTEILKYPKYYEKNPCLGKYPTRAHVNNVLFGQMIGHIGVSYLLPSKYRKIFQYTTISMETYAIGHNYSAGVRIRF